METENIVMRKLITVFAVFFCIKAQMQAQVQIQTTLPTVGLVQKNQLWNLLLINSTGNNLTGRLELVLFDRQTSRELMTASSEELTLAKGPSAININKVGPVIYNYIGIEPDRNINSLLPVGPYSVCYTFVRNPNSEKREMLAEECVGFDVEPLSPPMLMFPADSAILEIAPSQFSWTPPVPAALLNRLNYEILITEVLPSQKATEAIQENISFFNNDRLATNSMTYSGAQPAFEKDKWYAWQVIAKDAGNYAGKSETWVFKVAATKPAQEPVNATPYVQLRKSGAEKTVAAGAVLRFSYLNQLADSAVTMTVTDISNSANNKSQPALLALERGLNYIQKDISKFVKIQEGHVYLLTLENSAKEKWTILFEVKK